MDFAIDLNKRSEWMSIDEYIGGAFLYSEGIDTRSISKSFQLNPTISSTQINNRSTGYPVALVDAAQQVNNTMLAFTSDGRVEDNFVNNESSESWSVWGLFRMSDFTNAIKVDTNTYAIASVWEITKLILQNTSDGYGTYWDNQVTNEFITSNTWWTVWAWWATSAAWATHTSWGGTNVLEQAITVTGTVRIVIRHTWCTTWSVTISFGWSTVWTLTSSDSKNNRPVVMELSSWVWAPKNLTFTPTNTYNGSINWVQVNIIDETNAVFFNEITPSDATATIHPMVYKNLYLYVWNGRYVDVVDTSGSSWAILKTLVLDPCDVVVWITEMGWVFNIYTQNNNDSIQYRWDGVDDFPNEKIVHRNKKITAAYNDGNKDFFIVENDRRRYLYIANWRSPILLAQSQQTTSQILANTQKYLQLRNRYNFKWSSVAMPMLSRWSMLYISSVWWVYSYGTQNPVNPELPIAITKEMKINTSWAICMAAIQEVIYAWYYDTTNLVTYISTILSSTTPTTTWFLITKPFLISEHSDKKEFSRIKLWYKHPWWDGSIKIYVSTDDKFFWTFYVDGVSTYPSPWDTYYQWSTDNTFTVISAGSWIIQCKWVSDTDFNVSNPTWVLTKITWAWDSSISYTDYDNFVLVKTISWWDFRHDSSYIGAWLFLEAHLPSWHKAMLKIELNRSSTINKSPEVFNLYGIATIVKNDMN